MKPAPVRSLFFFMTANLRDDPLATHSAELASVVCCWQVEPDDSGIGRYELQAAICHLEEENR